MSYREIRDATEILRALSYPRLVSMENFRFPNFALMAEILEWSVKNIESEADRVVFVKSAVLLLLQKAHVKLNPKNLYQSDGHAVRELLPVLRMLYENFKSPTAPIGTGNTSSQVDNNITAQISELRSQINSKRQDLRRAIELAAELPQTGATVYELLSEEIHAKDVRTKALSQSLTVAQIEAEIQERIRQTEEQTTDLQQKLKGIDQDEQDLRSKIERRRRELEQLQKRLAKLESFQPPYMEEFERYKERLKLLYDVYVVLFRNLDFLRQQLWQVERDERERSANAEQSIRSAIEMTRLENEAAPLAIAGVQPDEDDDSDARQQQTAKEVRVFGNMTGAGLSDDDEEEGEEVIMGDDGEANGIFEEKEEEESAPRAEESDNFEGAENHSDDNF